MESTAQHRRIHWRAVLWASAALMLLLPVLAMQFSDEVDWDVADFILFGALLVVVGGSCELVARTTRSTTWRAALVVALAAVFILIWANAALGVIGNEGNAANLMCGGVLAVAIVGALIARFQPHAMVYVLVATALAQVSVGAIASLAGLGDTWMATAFFVVLWLISAWLFRKAALEQTAARAAD